MNRRSLTLASALLAGLVISCDSPTRVETTGVIVPQIRTIRDTTQRLTLPLEAVRVTVLTTGGAVLQTVPLTLNASNTAWSGSVENVPPGTYTVFVEGLATPAGSPGLQVQFFGINTNVSVTAGQQSAAPINFASAIPTITPLPPGNTTAFTQTVVFSAVPSATGYTVEASRSNTFTNPLQATSTSTTVPISVTDVGTWFLRARPTLPGTVSQISWSDPQQFTIISDLGGRTPANATAVPLQSGVPDTVRDRNITPTDRQGWYAITARLGDSIIAETRAARLTPASALTTSLQILRQDGVTVLGDGTTLPGTTDRRAAIVAPVAETFRVLVGGTTPTTVGHYEVILEIRRLPGAPTGLTTLAATGTSTTLNWTDNADNESTFRIERCAGVGCANFAEIGTTNPDITTFTDNGLTAGESYSYRVRARNGIGNSVYTNTSTIAMVAPAAPSVLTALTTSSTSITINWTDNASNESGFRIERCTGDGCTSFAEVATVGPNVTTFANSGLGAGNLFGYRVRAYNGVTESAYSNTARAGTVPPSAPTGLTTQTLSATQIRVLWTDPANDETGFRIERCGGAACSDFAEIGQVASNVTQYDDATAIADAVYRYRVRAVNVVGLGAYSVPVLGETRAPEAPTGLSATLISGTRIDLSWTNASASANAFEVQRCIGALCDTFAPLDTVATTTFSDVSVSVNNSYGYRVRALNAVGGSAASASATANTLLSTPASGLAAVTRSATVIRLTWTDNAFDETGFEVSRCTGAGCTNFAAIATTAAGVTTFDDSTATAGASFSYRVATVNLAGVSAPTNTATAATIVPTAPTTLTATTQSNTRIDLAWTDASADETGFYIERCTGAGCSNFATVDSVAAGVTAFEATGLASSTTFVFRVRAYNAAGVSAPSNTASAATNLPAIPTQLRARVFSATRIDLTWTDNASDELGVAIERCAGAGCTDFAALPPNAAANAVSISDATVAAGTTYRYRVRAFNAVGNSDFAPPVQVTTAVPSAPINLAANAQSTTRIVLNWNDASDNDTSFVVQRCTGAACVPATTIATLFNTLTDTLSVIDSTVAAGQVYRYHVVARNALGSSTPSNVAEAQTIVPATPTGLTATTVSAEQIDLAWVDAATNESGYEVERCNGTGCVDFVRAAELPAGTTSFENTGLAQNVVYRFRVRAVNGAGASAYSSIASAATDIPADPTNLVALASSPTSIGLTWTDNATTETGYTVERCAGGSCSDFTVLTLLAANVTSFNDGGLATGAAFRYRVQAVNVQGASRYSNVAIAATVLPDSPIDLLAITQAATRIRLEWSDEASDELGYVIERCSGVGCSSFAVIDTVGVNANFHIDSTAVVNTAYQYRIFAYNNVGVSGTAGPVAANTLIPAAATNLAAVVISSGRIDLTWTDGSTNEVGFRIDRCAGVGCTTFTAIDTVAADAAFYSDLSVALGTDYRYRVTPFNSAGDPGAVGPVDVSLRLPTTPAALSASIADPTSIALVWTDGSTNEDGFRIERCVGAGCNTFTELATTTPNDTTFTDVGLTGNTFYRYRVRAFNASGVSEYSPIAAPNTFLPGPPTSLVPTPRFANRIDLTWTDNASNESGFIVERCTGAACASFAVVDTLDPNTVTYADSSLTFATTYRYRVYAFNGVGASTATNIVESNTNVPLTPSALSASPNGITRIDLIWTDNADNESGFRIERCVGVGCTDFALLATVAANSQSYADETVVVGTAYRYRVVAFNIGSSSFTNVATATTIIPLAPTALAATAASGTRIDLTWTDNSDNELGYSVERCTGAGCSTFAVIAEIGPDLSAYSDSGLTTGANYSYRVRGYNNASASGYTNTATASPNVPAIPTALSATTISASRIDLAWVDNAGNETNYLVERCVGPSCTDFTTHATLAAGTTSYQDVGLAGSTSFRYRVRAAGASGNSAPSNIAAASTNAPADPTTLVATTASGTQIDLTWADNADNEVNYQVERCSGAGCTTFANIATIAANATGYSDNSAVIDTRYRYRVRAVNAAGASAYTAIADGSTLRPATATGLTALTTSSTSIRLDWTDAADNETGYSVERCAGTGCSDFGVVATLPANSTSFENTGLASATDFTYRVFAVNIVGVNAAAGPVTASTNLPADPSGLTATVISGSRIDLAWTDNANNETRFLIERCEGAGCGTFAVIDSVGPNLVAYSDLGITVGLEYSYRVRTRNAAGVSNPSDVASTNTFLPGEPAKLALALTGVTAVSMAWSDNSDNETGFAIERCAGEGCSDFVQVGLAPADSQLFVDPTITAGLLYSYRIRAVNAAGGSPYTAERAILAAAPAAPTALTSTIISASQTNLVWTDGSNSETWFHIERCSGVGCATFTVIDSTRTNDRSYLAGGLSIGLSYTFRVRAINAAGTSTASNLATAAMLVPTPPSTLAATTNSATSISLTWVDNADNEATYRVERCVGSGCSSFIQVASLTANTTAYADASVTLNNAYSYRVRATNAVGASLYTSVVEATTLTPAVPTGLTATPVTGQQVNLAWTDNADNETGYQVESCTGVGCATFASVATLAANATTYSATVTNNATHRFRVRALRTSVGASAYSTVAEGSTVLNAPSFPSALTYNRNRIDVRWSDNSSIETGYEILACGGVGCTPSVLIGTVGANVTLFEHSGLPTGFAVNYQVRAITTGANSDYTAVTGNRTPTVLTNATAIAVTDTAGAQRHFVIVVPAGTPELRVTISGGTGDADLYVRGGLSPTTALWECRPFQGGNAETCSIQNPTPGDYFIMLRGFAAFDNVTLRASNAIRQGFATQFGSSSGWSANYLHALQITTTTPVTMTHLGMLVPGTPTGGVKMGLYSNRIRNACVFPAICFIQEPGNLLASSVGTNMNGIAEYATSNVSVPAGTYWIAAIFETGGSTYYDPATPVGWKYISQTYATPLPATWPNSYVDYNFGRMNYLLRGVP